MAEKVYGLQFHLEVDEAMIHRWLKAGIRDRPELLGSGHGKPRRAGD